MNEPDKSPALPVTVQKLHDDINDDENMKLGKSIVCIMNISSPWKHRVLVYVCIPDIRTKQVMYNGSFNHKH